MNIFLDVIYCKSKQKLLSKQSWNLQKAFKVALMEPLNKGHIAFKAEITSRHILALSDQAPPKVNNLYTYKQSSGPHFQKLMSKPCKKELHGAKRGGPESDYLHYL